MTTAPSDDCTIGRYGYCHEHDTFHDDEIACIVCEDSGWVAVEYSDVRLPCPECDLGWSVER